MTDAASRTRIVFGSLNGLRFLLAVWIAWFHVGHMFDDSGMGSLPFLRMGAMRVDIFFVLSGFVLAHVYWNRSSKPFDYVDFLVARLARIYPMYLLALGVIAAYLAAGALIGKTPDRPYPLGDLFASIVFLQSFGVTETNSWNFPAWAVSAEIGGYILFPVFLWIADRFRRLPWAMLGLAVLAILGAELFSRHFYHLPLNNAVTDWGALRGAIMIFCGVAARIAFEDFDRGREGSVLVVTVGAIAAAAVAINNWGLPLIGFSAAMMIIALARLDQMEEFTLLSHPWMQRLGDYSYGIFILHAPIYSITAEALKMIGIEFHATLFTGFLMTLMVVLISIPVTRLVEKPARLFIRARWEKMRHHRLRHAGL